MGDIELGFRLKQAREKNKLTQEEACQKADIAKVQMLSSYERGVNNPPIETIKKLSRIYKVSVDSLLFGEDNTFSTEKTVFDYIVQLVDAVDNLGMQLKIESNSYVGTPDEYFVELFIQYAGFQEFVLKWIRLRNLLDSNTIEKNEYDVLMSQRFKELSIKLHKLDVNQIAFSLAATDELPF